MGSVKMRQMVEREIAHQVIDSLLEAGYTLGVYDGEEVTIHHSTDAKALKAALMTTDEDYIFVYIKGDDEKDERPQYWARLTYGNDGWDVLSDYLVHLEPVIGEGTKTQALIDKYSD